MNYPVSPRILREDSKNSTYTETKPSNLFKNIVSCFWCLSAKKQLDKSFEYLIIPDACVDLVFDISSKPSFDGALVMTAGLKVQKIDLGKNFNYVGIRFYPGVWKYNLKNIIDSALFLDVLGKKECAEIRNKSDEYLTILENFTQYLLDFNYVSENKLVITLINNIEKINFVKDMGKIVSLSERQLRRKTMNETGYRPHDLMKILRFHNSLSHNDISQYSDQAHYIRSFKKITNETPVSFIDLYTE